MVAGRAAASVQTPGRAVLTLDQDRLFAEVAFGQARSLAGIEADDAGACQPRTAGSRPI